MQNIIVPCPKRKNQTNDADTTCKEDCKFCGGIGYIEDNPKVLNAAKIDNDNFIQDAIESE